LNRQSLQDTVTRFTSLNHTSNDFFGSEDGSHIFEVLQPCFVFSS
jgi:exportin-T